ISKSRYFASNLACSRVARTISFCWVYHQHLSSTDAGKSGAEWACTGLGLRTVNGICGLYQGSDVSMQCIIVYGAAHLGTMTERTCSLTPTTHILERWMTAPLCRLVSYLFDTTCWCVMVRPESGHHDIMHTRTLSCYRKIFKDKGEGFLQGSPVHCAVHQL
ncbi:LOW QUALITY PROTEIN: ADP/ATP translocase 3, partial [Galemys pyrenaicus]